MKKNYDEEDEEDFFEEIKAAESMNMMSKQINYEDANTQEECILDEDEIRKLLNQDYSEEGYLLGEGKNDDDEYFETNGSNCNEEQSGNSLFQQIQSEPYGPYIYGMQLINKHDFCFLDVYGENNGKLCMFNGRYWETLQDDELRQMAYEILPIDLKKKTPAIEHLITNIANFVKHEIRQEYNNGEKRFTDDDYRAIENRIVFNNCVYDVRTGKKKRFSKKKPYYYGINCDYIDANLSTPTYDRLKCQATDGDVESMDMFDYAQAYLLIPNRKGKCFFTMSYARDSGKTTFGEFIEKYFDLDRVIKTDIEQLGSRFGSAGFDRARLVSCLEMPVTRLSASAAKAIKNFTGESNIVVEAKYQNPITCPVQFKMLFASNGGVCLPPGEMDEAFYRRLIVLPFVKSTPLNELIADLPEKLEAERSAIISKCVRKFKKHIAKDGGIVFPESFQSRELKSLWMGRSVQNERFVHEFLQFSGKREDSIAKKDLAIVYQHYYFENGGQNLCVERPIDLSREELIRLIKQMFPGINDSRRRISTLFSNEKENVHCLTGITWTSMGKKFIERNIENLKGDQLWVKNQKIKNGMH